MNGEFTIIIISLIISGLSFGISLLIYWRNRRSEQLKREQDSQMLILASQIVVFWEQLQNIAILIYLIRYGRMQLELKILFKKLLGLVYGQKLLGIIRKVQFYILLLFKTFCILLVRKEKDWMIGQALTC